MSDILSSLAQLQKSRSAEQPQVKERGEQPLTRPEADQQEGEAVSPAVQTPIPTPAPAEETALNTPEPSVSRGEGKTLAGRVPLALHRELTRGLLDAADELHVRRVNVDEALEAAVRVVLRDPQVHRRWLQEIQTVRRERREG